MNLSHNSVSGVSINFLKFSGKTNALESVKFPSL